MRRWSIVAIPLLVVALLAGLAQASALMPRTNPMAVTSSQTLVSMAQKRVTNAQREAAAAKLAAIKAQGGSNSLAARLHMFLSGANPLTFNSARRAPALTPSATPDYYGVANYANSQLPTLDAHGNVVPGTGIRKFVDSLPGLGYANRNNLGQYIPVAVPDQTTYPGSDYYVIALVEYKEKLGSDIPTTTLRGYEQVNTTDPKVSKPSYLGPTIVAQANRPVRVKFINELPTGAGGDLRLPVDTSIMGAGMGPDGGMYTQNRGTLHLHGGATPWISDGTPHQWTTPAGEDTTYTEGVSVHNVPDMDGGHEPTGTLTFYYTNQQSARLMFYHDHTYGLTRLNVYYGEAAPYILQDSAEQALVHGGSINANGTTSTVAAGTIPADQIPLVIQDKTFVPTDDQLAKEDPTWNKALWGNSDGSPGGLWMPHVYMPNQIAGNDALGNELEGINPFGRWDYGPWFYPPFLLGNGSVAGTPTPNPLWGQPGEPQMNPGTPTPTIVPEAFMDTPVVNGTAYPFVKVQRKAYRLRILNACDDRMLNLSLFYAASNTPAKTDAQGRPTLQTASGEVPMVPAAARTPHAPLFPIYALYNIKTQAHYYTPSQARAHKLLAIRPRVYTDLGVAMRYAKYSPGNDDPLYQIFNKKKGSWYYTTSYSQVKKYMKSPKTYRYDGIVWYVSTSGGAGKIPVYGFMDKRNGDWLLTTSTQLKANVAAKEDLTEMSPKGIRFYVALTGGPTVNNWPASWPTDGRDGGVPDPDKAGPRMIQIGNEGGFLPAPTILPNQPVGYEYFRRTITVLNVKDKNLMLGPAERADVIVDFSHVPAGSKIILYNDAPAPVPAFDSRLDYYTHDPDQTSSGGAPSTHAGYGPNTRTILQFQVDGNTAAPSFNVNALKAGLAKAYAATQPKPIVPESAYSSAFATSYPDNYLHGVDTTLTFTPADQSSPATFPQTEKAIVEGFDTIGRMNANLGGTLQNFGPQAQGVATPYDYADPPTDVTTNTIPGTQIGALNDGTQIWRIDHQGVDTHAIHFHLMNVQLINRIAIDGQLFRPDANELGWKETIRMNPGQDVIVAIRPMAPTLPWKLPDSVRLLEPSLPEGAQWTDTNGTVITNTMTDFGWEYVWHCHLLGHEENDMMRPFVFEVAPSAPTTPTATPSGAPDVTLNWVNTATFPAATDYVVERADDASFTANVVDHTLPGTPTSYVDTTVAAASTYYYRVRAESAAGYSAWSGTVTATTP